MRNLLGTLVIAVSIFWAGSAWAVTTTAPTPFEPEVPLPTFVGGPITATTMAEYIRAVFVYFIWIVGVLAVVMVIWGGIKWVAAAGNPARINDARDVINSAIIGLIIALISVVLLNLINPRLTSFQGLTLNTVKSELFETDNIVGLNGEGAANTQCQLQRGTNCPAFSVDIIAGAEGRNFVWPVSDAARRITSHFGPRDPVVGSKCHPGVDFGTDGVTGKTIVAMHKGVVQLPGKTCNEYVVRVVTEVLGKQYFTRYLHLSSVTMKNGQTVLAGQVIGYSGGDHQVAGNCSGAPHLHTELYVDGVLKDLEPCLGE